MPYVGTLAVGPAVAMIVFALLLVALRWTYGSRSRPPRRRRTRYGLLVPVALLPDRARADALRAVLADAGIRSTLAEHRDGDVELLVFPDDERRARRLVPPG